MRPTSIVFLRRILATAACVGSFVLGNAQAIPHGTPAVQGTSVADTNIPVVISTSIYGSKYFVLNKDLTTVTHSSVFPANSGYNQNCAAPSGLSASSTSTPRTLVNDTQNAYVTAKSSATTNEAVAGLISGSSICTPTSAIDMVGGVPQQTFSSNDEYHGRLFVMNAFGNLAQPDILTIYNNFNTGTGSSISKLSQISLDTGATYTSMVTDARSTYGLTAITELKDNVSPGNLWVYSPGISTAFKVLGPGGIALPAIGSFIIPAPNDGGGSWLVLINQDGITSSNLTTPPQDTTPFTIIDLGQLQRTFSAVVAGGNVIRLPSVINISATKIFNAMLGAAYNPTNHLLYAVVGSGSSIASAVVSYDLTNPAAPNETVVADVSNVPYTFGAYPQLALNAASGTLQILTSSPTALYSVGITGTGNTAVAVSGTPFADSSFAPTYIAANPLLGETYIASSGSIDILTKPTTSPLQATLTLNGADTVLANASYFLRGLSLYANGDSALIGATVTISATPKSGTAYTFATKTVGDFAYPGGNVSGTFPSAGVYTLVATVPATATHAAITSNPVIVTVGATTNTGVYPTTLTLSLPATATGTTATASLTLNGSTYGPVGRIVITDASNTEVGRYTFTGAAVQYPVTAIVTLPSGTSTLTAQYINSGDDQNQASTSAPATITVGTSTTTTPTLTQVTPATGTSGATLSGTVTFASTTTKVPTDNISVYAVPSGSTIPITLATIPASQAFVTGGKAFTFTAPSAGTYTVLAYYPGDTNYSTSTSNTSTLTTTAVSTTAPTTVSLSATSNNTVGDQIRVTATLKATSAPSAQPTGNITVVARGNTTGYTDTTTFAAFGAYASGGFVFFLSLPTADTYTLTITYPGDSKYAASTASLGIVVSMAPTTLSLSAASTSAVGVPFATTLTLKSTATPSTPPTGLVTIVAKGNTTGTTDTTRVPAAQAYSASGFLYYTTLNTPDTYTLTATYPGDSVYSASSASIGITVTLPQPTLTLSGAVNGFTKTPISYTATFSLPVPGTPTGNITIASTLNGVAGPSVVVGATQASVVGGATGTLTFTSPGTYLVTATYPGDSTFGPATSSALSVAIIVTGSVPAFAMKLDDPAYELGGMNELYLANQTQPVSTSFTLTASGGFTTPVKLTATDLGFHIGITFTDVAGNTITTATPTTAGTKINVVLTPYVNGKAELIPAVRLTRLPVYFAIGFGGISLLGLRKRTRLSTRVTRILSVLCIVGFSSTLLGGCLGNCDDDLHRTITITATPATQTQGASPQTLDVQVRYVKELEGNFGR